MDSPTPRKNPAPAPRYRVPPAIMMATPPSPASGHRVLPPDRAALGRTGTGAKCGHDKITNK